MHTLTDGKSDSIYHTMIFIRNQRSSCRTGWNIKLADLRTWLINSVTIRLTKWLTDWLTDFLNDCLICCNAHWNVYTVCHYLFVIIVSYDTFQFHRCFRFVIKIYKHITTENFEKLVLFSADVSLSFQNMKKNLLLLFCKICENDNSLHHIYPVYFGFEARW